jgi:hypothetical protein
MDCEGRAGQGKEFARQFLRGRIDQARAELRELAAVMAGLVPAIHVFPVAMPFRRGCPAQGRA